MFRPGVGKWLSTDQMPPTTCSCIVCEPRMIFRLLNVLKKKINIRILFHDIWKLYDLHVLVSGNKVYGRSQAHLLTRCVWPSLSSVRVERSGPRPQDPQNWSRFIPGPSPTEGLCWRWIKTSIRCNRRRLHCPSIEWVGGALSSEW